MTLISNNNHKPQKESQTKITFRLYPHEKRAFNNVKRTVKTELYIDISTSAFLRHCMRQARNVEFLYEIGFISRLEFMQLCLMKEKKNIKYPRAKNLKKSS